MPNKELKLEDIEVPQFMIDAVMERYTEPGPYILTETGIRRDLEVALLALANKPIFVTREEADEIQTILFRQSVTPFMHHCLVEWQRRMFLKKARAIPEELRPLLMNHRDLSINQPEDNEREANARILKAYQMGLSGRER